MNRLREGRPRGADITNAQTEGRGSRVDYPYILRPDVCIVRSDRGLRGAPKRSKKTSEPNMGNNLTSPYLGFTTRVCRGILTSVLQHEARCCNLTNHYIHNTHIQKTPPKGSDLLCFALRCSEAFSICFALLCFFCFAFALRLLLLLCLCFAVA